MNINQRYNFYKVQDQFLESNEHKQKLVQWGINLQRYMFRYDLEFQEFVTDVFFNDFFNNENVKEIFQSSDNIKVQYQEKKCTAINFNMLDFFEENKIIGSDGELRETFQIFFEDINLSTLLAQSFMKDELEQMGEEINPLVQDLDDNYLKTIQDEFLFQILKLLLLGGRYNQYECNINNYREITKFIYKNTVEQFKKYKKE